MDFWSGVFGIVRDELPDGKDIVAAMPIVGPVVSVIDFEAKADSRGEKIIVKGWSASDRRKLKKAGIKTYGLQTDSWTGKSEFYVPSEQAEEARRILGK